MEKLEDRVLFDGVPDAPVLDNVPAVDLPIEAAADQVSQVQDVSQLEIVFLDPAVENGDQLLVELLMSASERSMEVHLLDAGEDGLEQIADYLEGRSDIGAIHIISHGEDAKLRLGDAEITGEELAGMYAAELAEIGEALADDADILLYGCDLAGNTDGEAFLETFASITGADVAASDDLTGAAELGGDWELEVATGEIETGSLNALNWFGLLTSKIINEGGGQAADGAD